MPKFSQDSFSKLSTCHIDLQTLFYEVVKTFDCQILDGHRNQVDQEQDFIAGHTKLHFPYGKHNTLPSNAVDVSPFPVDWKNTKRFYWFAGYVIGIAQKLKDEGKINHSISWGGNWDGNIELNEQSFNDLVHFEIIL